MTARARTPTKDIAGDLAQALAAVREHLGPELETDGAIGDAWATVETFCAVALRVIATTNPSKVRREAVTVEIQSLMRP